MAPTAELSPREVQVVELIVEGLAYAAIAYQMDLSEHTVRSYARTAAWKLHLPSGTVREALVGWWWQEGRERYADNGGEATA